MILSNRTMDGYVIVWYDAVDREYYSQNNIYTTRDIAVQSAIFMAEKQYVIGDKKRSVLVGIDIVHEVEKYRSDYLVKELVDKYNNNDKLIPPTDHLREIRLYYYGKYDPSGREWEDDT